MPDAEGNKLQIGDLVFHRRYVGDDDVNDRQIGNVVGFGPDRKWVRIKTNDGRHRLWLETNIYNVDAICGEGNYA